MGKLGKAGSKFIEKLMSGEKECRKR